MFGLLFCARVAQTHLAGMVKMGLKAVVSDIEAVDEGVKGFYTKIDDESSSVNGKYVLSVDASEGYTLENTEGLRTVLGEKKAKLTKLRDKYAKFDGLDADKVKADLKKYADIKDIDPEKEADKLADKRAETIASSKIDQLQALHKTAITKVEVERDKYRGWAAKAGSNDLPEAIVSAGFMKESIPLVKAYVESRSKRIETDNGFKMQMLDANGNPLIADGSGREAALQDVLTTMAGSDEFSRFVEGRNKKGSGSQPGTTNSGGSSGGSTSNPYSKETFNLTAQFALEKKNPQEAARLKASA